MSLKDLGKCLKVLMRVVSAEQFSKSIFFLKIKVFQLIENTSPAELEGKKKTRNQT